MTLMMINYYDADSTKSTVYSPQHSTAHSTVVLLWLIHRLVGWVVGWLGGWVVGWLGGWVVGWLGGWVVGWLGGWVVGWLGGWMTRICLSRAKDFLRRRTRRKDLLGGWDVRT